MIFHLKKNIVFSCELNKISSKFQVNIQEESYQWIFINIKSMTLVKLA